MKKISLIPINHTQYYDANKVNPPWIYLNNFISGKNDILRVLLANHDNTNDIYLDIIYNWENYRFYFNTTTNEIAIFINNDMSEAFNKKYQLAAILECVHIPSAFEMIRSYQNLILPTYRLKEHFKYWESDTKKLSKMNRYYIEIFGKVKEVKSINDNE